MSEVAVLPEGRVFVLPTGNSKIRSVQIDGRKVRKQLRDGRKYINNRYLEVEKKDMAVLNSYVVPELRRKLKNDEPLNLYLPEDVIQEKVDLTLREIKSAKERLSASGLLYIPEGMKQSGQGTYPLWLFNFDFLKIVSDSPEKKTNPRKHWALTKGEVLAAKFYEAVDERYEQLIYSGVQVISSAEFWMPINVKMSQERKHLEAQGLLA